MDGIILEFRSALRDFGSKGTDWRRLGIRALPLAAVAALGAGGLCVKKRCDPPESSFLAQRVSFHCREAPTGAGEADHSLQVAGVDLGALRRAARRLRGPLERDLVSVERTLASAQVSDGEAGLLRRQLYHELIERWRAAGYLAEPLEQRKPHLAHRGIDPVTQVDEAYGRDVGCEVPLCLLSEQGEGERGALRTLPPEEWAAAAEALEAHGVALLRALLPPGQVRALRRRLGVQESALDRAKAGQEEAAPVREYDAGAIQEEDPELEGVPSTLGRRHFHLRGKVLEEAVRGAQAGAMPLVWEHLTRSAAAAGLPPSQQPYISEVQLLVTDPCAAEQFWHVDNSAPGLTLFVPLTPVPEDIGPTLFLPGSHHLLERDGIFTRLGRFVPSLLASDGIAVGTMGPGDALIYDARIMHRGAANHCYDRTRVALVFRYDFERPPGVGPIGTQLMSWTGNALAGLQRCYGALPGKPGDVGALAQQGRSRNQGS